MNDYTIKSLRLITFVIIISLFTPMFALANGAKPIENPTDQVILFDENSGVGLVEETVTFKIEEENYRKAKVEVEYNLANLTDKEQSFDIFFITSNIADNDFSVKINDKKIEDIAINEKAKRPQNWHVSEKVKIIEPIGKKVLDKSPGRYNSYYSDSINGAIFPVNIKASESVKLNISYYSESGFYRYENVINTVYSQLYYLTPAKFWEGETKVNLRIELPKTRNIEVFSNIPMSKKNNYTYETTIDKIPDKEWLFSFTERKSLIFGINNRLQHNGYLVAIAITLFIITIIMKSKSKNKVIRYCLYLLIVASILNIKPTYSFMFMFMIFIVYNPLFYFLLLFIFVKKIKNKSK